MHVRQLNIFLSLFTENVWDLLITETTRFAAQAQLPEGARPWYPVIVEEIKASVGMVILMGIVRLPIIEQCWQTFHELIRQPLVTIMLLTRLNRSGDSYTCVIKHSKNQLATLIMTTYSRCDPYFV